MTNTDPRTLSHREGNMPEWTEYVLVEVKDSIQVISTKLEGKLSLQDIQPILAQIELILKRLDGLNEMQMDYQRRVDKLKDMEDRLQALIGHYQVVTVPVVENMLDVVQGLNMVSSKVEGVVEALGLVNDGYGGYEPLV